MKDWKSFYFSPKGRLGQRDFGLYFLGPWIFLVWVLSVLGSSASLLLDLFLLLSIWPLAVTHIKRFHDFGQSEVVSVLLYPTVIGVCVSFLLSFGFSMAGNDEKLDMAMMYFEILYYGILIFLTIPIWIPGQKAENKYGMPT